MTIKELENQISKLQTELEKLKQAEKEKNKEELKNKLKPWRAEEVDNYYYINSSGEVFSDIDGRFGIDDKQYTFGNYYYTKELARQDAKELALRNRVRQLRDALCEGYQFKVGERNWHITRFRVSNMFQPMSTTKFEHIGDIYFDTYEHAQQVCDILNAELNSYME